MANAENIPEQELKAPQPPRRTMRDGKGASQERDALATKRKRLRERVSKGMSHDDKRFSELPMESDSD